MEWQFESLKIHRRIIYTEVIIFTETMANTQIQNLFYFVLFSLWVTSCLQLLATVGAMPFPTNKIETDCYCNGTNLTSLVDGHFLHKWLKFNTNHSIRHLSEAARNLTATTNDLQVSDLFTAQN